MTEDQIVGGAIPDEQDDRDFAFGSVAPYPFDIGFDIEMILGYRATCKNEAEFFGAYGRAGWGIERYKEIKKTCEEKKVKPFSIAPKNQGAQMSCTGQASSQYLSVLNFIETGTWVEFSARDIYSAITLGEGKGARLRDAMKRCVDPGVATEELVPTYESFMTDHGLVRNPITEKQACVKPEDTDEVKAIRKIMSSKEYRTVVRQNTEMMDAVAWATLQGFGCFFGVIGENNGTWMSENPQPPKTNGWGHALFVGKVGTNYGAPYVGVINSWGNGVGAGGWQRLSANYFLTIVDGQNAVFNPWTLIDKPNMSETNAVILKDVNSNTVGIFLPCTNPEALKSLAFNFGMGELPSNENGLDWDALIKGEYQLKK